MIDNNSTISYNSPQWNFVEAPANIPAQSGEDPSFDSFKSSQLRCLVREYIQNSLDVPADKSRKTPVKVKISLMDLDTRLYPNLVGEELLNHLEACKKSCEDNQHAKNPYEAKVDYMLSNLNRTIKCLCVADYNTTGMEYKSYNQPCDFKAGVRSFGASHKGSDVAGGSHGQGKTIGFVSSEINAVYYSTKTEDGSVFGEGVIRLCNHTIKDKTYCASAFFDCHNGERPDSVNEIPEIFKREDTGTSVFVLGFKNEEDCMELMKQHALRSFWMAILHNQLEVTIDEEIFNCDNIEEKMLMHFPDENWGNYDKIKNRRLVERFNPRPYLIDCVIKKDNTDHYVFEASSSVYPTLQHAVLYIYKDENIKQYSHDRIVCMRDREMVIEFRPASTRKGFYGVLVCDGEGSQILRQMENVTHDEWTTYELQDMSEEVKRKGRQVVNEIKKFIETSIEKIFPTTVDTEYRVSALSKYLFSSGNRNNDAGIGNKEADDSAYNPEGPVSTTANDLRSVSAKFKKSDTVSLRKKGGVKKKKNKVTSEDGLQVSTQPIQAPVTNDDTNTQPPKSDPDVNPKPSEPTEKPEKDVEANDSAKVGNENGKEGKHEKKKKGKHAEEAKALFRVLPQVSDSGLIHRIMINSPKDYNSCSMTISIAGADSDSQLDFAPLNNAYQVVGKNRNILTGFDLVKGKNYIDIKFEDSDFHSLKIKAHEN